MSKQHSTLFIRPNVIYLSRGLSRLLDCSTYRVEIVTPGKSFKISPDGPVTPFPSDPNSIARRHLDTSFPVGRYTGKPEGKGFLFDINTLTQPEPKRPFVRSSQIRLPDETFIIDEPMNEPTVTRMLQLLRTRRHDNLETVAAILRGWKKNLS